MLKRAALLGFLAVLIVGSLSGFAEAGRRGGCYRGGCGSYGGYVALAATLATVAAIVGRPRNSRGRAHT